MKFSLLLQGGACANYKGAILTKMTISNMNNGRSWKLVDTALVKKTIMKALIADS